MSRTKRNQVIHKTEDNIRLGSERKKESITIKGKQGDYMANLKSGRNLWRTREEISSFEELGIKKVEKNLKKKRA